MENSSLKDKANSFQLKIEKIQIENEILAAKDANKTRDDIVYEVDIECARVQRRVDRLTSELREETEVHERNVSELTTIIETMKQQIAENLKLRQMSAD
jgi:hypothetical protein